LTLSEIALIAGLAPAPSIYSPYQNIELAIKNRNKVLESMYIDGYISLANKNNAMKEKINLNYQTADNFLDDKLLINFILEETDKRIENKNDYKFLRINKALSKGWACWVKFNDTNLDWTLYLQPIDELSQIKEFFSNNKFVFLSALRKDNFFQMYFKKHSLDIDLVINFKSNFEEKKISLYIPSKQLLPNNPLFTNSILDKCKKLILFRKGLTLLLSDDIDLKTNLATELAST